MSKHIYDSQWCDPSLKPELKRLILKSETQVDLSDREALAMVELAKHQRVVPLMYQKTQREDIRQGLQQAYDKIERKQTKRWPVLREVFNGMAEAGIPVALLKGSLLSNTLFEDCLYKDMNDADVLVPVTHLEQAQKFLLDYGFEAVVDVWGEEEDPTAFNLPMMMHIETETVISIHFNLKSSATGVSPDIERIWQDVKPIESMHVNALRMSWEDTLLHICIDLPMFKIGLREFIDLANIINEYDIDWQVFEERVFLWKAFNGAYRLLACLRYGLGMDIPDLMLKNIRRHVTPMVRWETDSRFENWPVRRSTVVGDIERAYFVNAISDKENQVSFWSLLKKSLFQPSDKVLIDCFGKAGLVQRILLPPMVFQAMALDYGWKKMLGWAGSTKKEPNHAEGEHWRKVLSGME